jgi:hypothetical protein
MEIKFQIKKRCFSLCIGNKTPWFEQTYLIMLIELWYEKKEIICGDVLWKI